MLIEFPVSSINILSCLVDLVDDHHLYKQLIDAKSLWDVYLLTISIHKGVSPKVYAHERSCADLIRTKKTEDYVCS